jgi:hypothetical protein
VVGSKPGGMALQTSSSGRLRVDHPRPRAVIRKDRGRIASNACERGGRLYRANRSDKVLTNEDIDAFQAVAAPELRLALTMAVWTGREAGRSVARPVGRL